MYSKSRMACVPYGRIWLLSESRRFRVTEYGFGEAGGRAGILLFREQGITGERFADTIARLGFENVERQLLSDELLQRKSENLGAQKHMKGGATC